MNKGFSITFLCIVVLLTLTLPFNSSGLDVPEPSRLEKVLEWKGYYGGLREPEVMVIKDQKTWDGVYQMISESRIILSLDFSRYMVIAVFMGEKRTGGYTVNILRAEETHGIEMMEYKNRGDIKHLAKIKEKIFLVEYEEISPGPKSFVTMAITTPYHIKVVKRSDLPVLFVKYEKMRN